MSEPVDQPLRGRTIVTTRDEPGALDELLARLGADVVSVPLIEIVEAPDGGAAMAAALERIDDVRLARRHVTPRRRSRRRRGRGTPRSASPRWGRRRPPSWPSDPDDWSSWSRVFSSRPRWSSPSPTGAVVGPRRPSRPRRRHGRRRSASPRVRRGRVHRLLDPLADAERGRRGPRPRRRRGRVRVGFGGRGVGRGDRHAHATDRVRDRPDDRVGRDQIRPQGQRCCCRSHGARSRPRAHRVARRRFVDSHRHPAPEERHEAHSPTMLTATAMSSARPAICIAVVLGGLALPAAAAGGARRGYAAAPGSSVPSRLACQPPKRSRPRASVRRSRAMADGSCSRVAPRTGRGRPCIAPTAPQARRSSCRTSPRRCDRATRSCRSSAPMGASSSSRPSSPSICSATTTTTSAGTSIASSSPSAEARPTRGSWSRPRRERGLPVTTSSSPIRRPCRAAERWWRSPTRPRARPTASPRSPSST